MSNTAKNPNDCKTPISAWLSYKYNAKYPEQANHFCKVAFMAGVIWGASTSRNAAQETMEKAMKEIDK